VRCAECGGTLWRRANARTGRIWLACRARNEWHTCPGIGTPNYAAVQAAILELITAELAATKGNPARRPPAKVLHGDVAILQRRIATRQTELAKLGRLAAIDDAYEPALHEVQGELLGLHEALAEAQDAADAPKPAVNADRAARLVANWAQMTDAEANRALQALRFSASVRRAAFAREPMVDRITLTWT
jgi:hypothetical protein